jgi:HD-like signal output (HDOD) protein
LYRQQPELSRVALERCIEESIALHMTERDVFGFDHGEVGAELMREWNLPESFVEIAIHHHQPSAAERYRLETAIVHLADVITGMAHSTASGTAQVATLEPGAWELTGLSVDVMEPVIAEADAQFDEARSAILQPAGKAA